MTNDASDDGTARLWDVEYHDTMNYLCSRLQRDFTPAEQAEYDITNHTPTCPRQPSPGKRINPGLPEEPPNQ